MPEQLDGSKITSYKELIPLIQQIKDELEKKGRGFVFATLPKDDENGQNNKPLVCIVSKDESGNALLEFWAGMMSLVEALNNAVPESDREMWKESWLTFIKATNFLCFPSLRIEKME